jgi:lactoylglutathione lyase
VSDGWIAQPGLILFTENYAGCVRFYRETLGLPLIFEKDQLCALRFGSGYLMLETGGHASAEGKARRQNPVTLRINVADVEAAAAMLRERGVDVEVRRWDWGTTGSFLDPDGNRCELRDHSREFFGAAS